MDQLSRTSLFSEISDLSVTGVDDGDQHKALDAGTSKLVRFAIFITLIFPVRLTDFLGVSTYRISTVLQLPERVRIGSFAFALRRSKKFHPIAQRR